MTFINQIHIKNFKSIVDLTLDLGRVNLFIGENGSGKSNILEALAFAASDNNGRINISILSSKGARISNLEQYRNAFENQTDNIKIDFLVKDDSYENEFFFKNDAWFNDAHNKNIKSDLFLKNFLELFNLTLKNTNDKDILSEKELDKAIKLQLDIDISKLKENTSEEIKNEIIQKASNLNAISINVDNGIRYINDFLIYSPEVSALRKFEEEGQVSPLGAHGEGLFSLIKSLAADNGSLQHIKEHLEVIDWFEDFSIPNDLMSNEYKISIKDRFINSDLKYLDQRSANEGFLFLLFYIVLFSSKKTPQFFAIDNIEASFNPKLCAKLINMFVDLSKKNDKQVLMTTHNPATLNGLNLNDPEQRLFVVRRNIDGHTIVTRITEKPKTTAQMKLSEMWTKGLLGGLPDNF